MLEADGEVVPALRKGAGDGALDQRAIHGDPYPSLRFRNDGVTTLRRDVNLPLPDDGVTGKIIRKGESGADGYPWADDPEIYPVAPEIPIDFQAASYGNLEIQAFPP